MIAAWFAANAIKVAHLLCGASWTRGRVGGPKTRLKSAAFVKAMHARISFAALKQDVIAILSPRLVESSPNNSAPMPPRLIVRVRDDVFYETILPTAP